MIGLKKIKMALKQYIDLYREHQQMIDAGSATPLNALRAAAADELSRATLPKRGSENFENIDLTALLAPDYGINLQRIPLDVNPADTFHCDVPVRPNGSFMVVNDIFADTPAAAEALPEGVMVCSLRTAALDYPELITPYYGHLVELSNPLTALNTMLVQDGIFVHVPAGVKVEDPVQIVNILSGAIPMMAVRRMLVVAEAGAEIKILTCDHSQRDDVQLCALETVEIFAAEDARVDYYCMEESTPTTTRLSTLYLEQQSRSDVNIVGMTLFNGVTRNEYRTRFAAPDSHLRLYGMGIEDDTRSVSAYSHISHAAPRCKSDELFKFTADHTSTAAFTGRILVAPGACGTEAYQASRNLLGSDTAKIYSKPQLEIYNDDVKCSHGCAIGRLDPMQLFYMRTRGLSEAEATLLLRQAFMSDVLAAVEIPALRDRMQHLVACRFAGVASACASCKNKF